MAYVDKFVVYIRDPRQQRELGYFKAEYAFDEQGRLWRRTTSEDRPAGYWNSRWTRTTPWHVADCYAWFPGDTTPPAGSRRMNQRGLLPKRVERFGGPAGVVTIVKEA